MSVVAEAIDGETEDLRVIARAMCSAEVESGAAPCTCGEDLTRCCAFDVYGHQARAVRATLAAHGRLNGAPVRLTPELVEGFFSRNALLRSQASPAVPPFGGEASPIARTSPSGDGVDGDAS